MKRTMKRERMSTRKKNNKRTEHVQEEELPATLNPRADVARGHGGRRVRGGTGVARVGGGDSGARLHVRVVGDTSTGTTVVARDGCVVVCIGSDTRVPCSQVCAVLHRYSSACESVRDDRPTCWANITILFEYLFFI